MATSAFARSSGAPHLPMAGGAASVAPALERYGGDTLAEKLWKRPGLSMRDRSVVTISALVSTGQSGQLPGHLTRALDDGLTQAEASEAISHLASYGGWPNAFSAAAIARTAFARHGKAE